jgi:hypothetical protein
MLIDRNKTRHQKKGGLKMKQDEGEELREEIDLAYVQAIIADCALTGQERR